MPAWFRAVTLRSALSKSSRPPLHAAAAPRSRASASRLGRGKAARGGSAGEGAGRGGGGGRAGVGAEPRVAGEFALVTLDLGGVRGGQDRGGPQGSDHKRRAAAQVRQELRGEVDVAEHV